MDTRLQRLLMVVSLAWLELFAGVCLVGGVFVGGALLVSTGMGVLFTFVLASALWRHLDISCGCFSTPSADKISHLSLIRAIVITAVSAAYAGTIFLQPREWQLPLSEIEDQRARAASREESLLPQA